MLRSSDSKYGTYRGRSDSVKDTDPIEEIIIMVILMAIAAGMRLWKLGEWSFWADEIFSLQDVQKLPAQMPINPPIYFLIRFITDKLGMSEWSARLGPCIIGIISIPLLYWPAKRIFNARVGVIACAFLAVHPWHIYWSQNARAYSLSFLLGGLAALLFYLALERDSIGYTISSFVLTVLAVLSYPQSVILIPMLAGYAVLIMFIPVGIPKGWNGKNLVTYFFPFILALLALLVPSIRQYIVSGWGHNVWGRSPLHILFTVLYCVSVPVIMAAFAGGMHSLIYLNRAGFFMICYAIIPLVMVIIVSPFLNVAGYYLFFTMPAYLLLAAFCASELMDSAAGKSKLLAATVILIVLAGLAAQDYIYFTVENGGRSKWREAFQTVSPRIGQDDTVVISMPRIANFYLREYRGKGGAIGSARAALAQVTKLEDVTRQLGTMEYQWRREGRQIWFILDQPCLTKIDSDRRFREWLYANCQLVEEFPVYVRFRDRTIGIWQMKSKGPLPLY